MSDATNFDTWAASKTRPPKLLVVEDDPGMQKVYKVRLEDIGCECTLAGTVREALELTKLAPVIDVIILDLRLPDGTGGRVAEVFKKINPSINVIVITGHAGDLLEEVARVCPFTVISKAEVYYSLPNVLRSFKLNVKQT